jgi:hypothetical protein
MPISTNRANFKRRLRGGSEPDHDNAGCHDRERHHRVHYNAERTMISITADSMHMRHLGHGQKREQNQAHNSRNPKSAWLWAMNPAGTWPDCVQHNFLMRIVHGLA